MSALIQPQTYEPAIVYPESDGLPMADNTKQFEWIVTVKENLDVLLSDFVAGNIFWYPVKGNPNIKQAPDVLVALGRPKGDRSSYLQWEENHIAPQVVFEILSPGNTVIEMAKKERFYQLYGVEEYYMYDPTENNLFGWIRNEGKLHIIPDMNGWTSPHLGMRFELAPETMHLYRPDGERFLTFRELEGQKREAQVQAETERIEKEAAQAKVQEVEEQLEQERQRTERLKQKLKELGLDPDQL